MTLPALYTLVLDQSLTGAITTLFDGTYPSLRCMITHHGESLLHNHSFMQILSRHAVGLKILDARGRCARHHRATTLHSHPSLETLLITVPLIADDGSQDTPSFDNIPLSNIRRLGLIRSGPADMGALDKLLFSISSSGQFPQLRHIRLFDIEGGRYVEQLVSNGTEAQHSV